MKLKAQSGKLKVKSYLLNKKESFKSERRTLIDITKREAILFLKENSLPLFLTNTLSA